MSSKSSFLPRISFSRAESPSLPFYNRPNQPLRNKRSEYDLDDLSPRPDDGLLAQDPDPDPEPIHRSSFASRMQSPPSDFSDRNSARGSPSQKHRVLFAGPPPPIAKSILLYRDEEDHRGTPSPGRSSDRSVSARNAIGSVLFPRPSPSAKDPAGVALSPDSVWRNLQNRERALQKELQVLLDIQVASLAAGGGSGGGSPSASRTSAAPQPPSSSAASSSSSSRIPMDRATASGAVIPVRQPRPRQVGLRGARAGLTRCIAQLADLKTDEDASLAAALSTRKQALAQLRRLAARRDGIAGELRALEEDDDEPLTRELRALTDEHREVCAKAADLEERLARLRSRRRSLESKMEALGSQREAGLSGYRGALREADAQINAVLRRPPVRPLDVEAVRAGDGEGDEGEAAAAGAEPAIRGPEFLRLLPERRTAVMAKDWWEGEVRLLERRKAEVDRERAALEAGEEVWKEVVRLVSDFEADVRKQMSDDGGGSGSGGTKGKKVAPTPEEMARSTLARMGGVITGLEQRMRIVEEKGWNLLIAAIGAELAAFNEAEQMMRQSLGEPEADDDKTPRLGRSMSESQRKVQVASREEEGDPAPLVDALDDGSSDNEVPSDLLVAQEDTDGDRIGKLEMEDGKRPQDEESEDEVPPEFLAEHHDGEAF